MASLGTSKILPDLAKPQDPFADYEIEVYMPLTIPVMIGCAGGTVLPGMLRRKRKILDGTATVQPIAKNDNIKSDNVKNYNNKSDFDAKVNYNSGNIKCDQNENCNDENVKKDNQHIRWWTWVYRR